MLERRSEILCVLKFKLNKDKTPEECNVTYSCVVNIKTSSNVKPVYLRSFFQPIKIRSIRYAR